MKVDGVLCLAFENVWAAMIWDQRIAVRHTKIGFSSVLFVSSAGSSYGGDLVLLIEIEPYIVDGTFRWFSSQSHVCVQSAPS